MKNSSRINKFLNSDVDFMQLFPHISAAEIFAMFWSVLILLFGFFLLTIVNFPFVERTNKVIEEFGKLDILLWDPRGSPLFFPNLLLLLIDLHLGYGAFVLIRSSKQGNTTIKTFALLEFYAFYVVLILYSVCSGLFVSNHLFIWDKIFLILQGIQIGGIGASIFLVRNNKGLIKKLVNNLDRRKPTFFELWLIIITIPIFTGYFLFFAKYDLFAAQILSYAYTLTAIHISRKLHFPR